VDDDPDWRHQFYDDSMARCKDEKAVVSSFSRLCVRSHEAGITLSARKVYWGFRELEVLSKMVGPGTIAVSDDHMSALLQRGVPTSRTELQQLVGVVKSLGAPVLAHLRHCLAPLEREQAAKGSFVWRDDMQRAFEECMRVCSSPPIATPFSRERPLFLITDASNDGGSVIFAHLTPDGTRLQIVDCLSVKWSPAERRYHASEKELAMVRVARAKRPSLLLGAIRVIWLTDAKIMKEAWTSWANSTSPRVQRTLLETQDVKLLVKHVSGAANMIADWLSRDPAHRPPIATAPVAAVDDVVSLKGDDDDDESNSVEEIVIAQGVGGAPQTLAAPLPPPPPPPPVPSDGGGEAVRNPLYGVGRPPSVSDSAAARDIEAIVDKPDASFLERVAGAESTESRSAWEARVLARQRDDPALTALFDEARVRASKRAQGDIADLDDVPPNATGAQVLRPELARSGMLYVRIGGQTHWCLAVPDGMKTEIAQALHSGVGAGHWGPRHAACSQQRASTSGGAT